jgi:hypothetical protein
MNSLYPIFIGFLYLKDLSTNLDITQPLYVAPLIESTSWTALGQRIDHHYIMVTQPDVLNRVHYCRIPVVNLVYHNGVAFAPNYEEQLAKMDQMRGKVVAWLVGEGYEVRAGMVALPEGMMLLEGVFQEVEKL